MAQPQQQSNQPKQPNQPNQQHRTMPDKSSGSGMARQSGSQSGEDMGNEQNARELDNRAWDREESADVTMGGTDIDADKDPDISGGRQEVGRGDGEDVGAQPSEFGSRNSEEENLNQMDRNESEVEHTASPNNMPNMPKERSGGMQSQGKESIV